MDAHRAQLYCKGKREAIHMLERNAFSAPDIRVFKKLLELAPVADPAASRRQKLRVADVVGVQCLGHKLEGVLLAESRLPSLVQRMRRQRCPSSTTLAAPHHS